MTRTGMPTSSPARTSTCWRSIVAAISASSSVSPLPTSSLLLLRLERGHDHLGRAGAVEQPERDLDQR